MKTRNEIIQSHPDSFHHKDHTINVEISEKMMLDVKEIFDSRGIPFWLWFGTFLGPYRDGKLMDADGDIDLAVYLEDMPRIIQCDDLFKAKGFEFAPTPDSVLYRDGEHIDLCTFMVEGDKRVSTDGIQIPKDAYRIDSRDFETARWFPWRGKRWRILNNPEKWLAYLYRSTWRTPIAGKDWIPPGRSPGLILDANSMRKLLMSFPRSGSTWIRMFFENYTGKASKPFPGVLPDFSKLLVFDDTEDYCLERYHYFRDACPSDNDAVVLVLRDPFNTIASNVIWENVKEKDRGLYIRYRVMEYYFQIRCYVMFPGRKCIIYYEDLIKDFENTIIKAISTFGYDVDSDKIRKFNEKNFENWENVNKFFKSRGRKPTFENMDFKKRRDILTVEEKSIIKEMSNHVKKRHDHWMVYKGKYYNNQTRYDTEAWEKIDITKIFPIVERYIENVTD